MVASLEATQRVSHARVSTLEEELSAKLKQLQKAEDEVAFLRATVEDLDTHVAQLST